MSKITRNTPFDYGYNVITTMEDKEENMMMDFGLLRLKSEQIETDNEQKERAFLLITGKAKLEWDGNSQVIERSSFLDESPWVLHVPQGMEVKITGIGEDTEISVTKTVNSENFTAKLYTPEECASEDRGKGSMKETSTRIVRTVFDYTNAPYAKLVVGEVIDFPGKWSSYPPHHHPQPEIYFYKLFPENGFGFSMLGDDVVKVTNNDTVKVPGGLSHPQVSAPGYAMYYIWVIRHLDDEPYITPTFEPEHLWVTESDAKIWPDKE
ncbi:5-deoxy-glucuronate isomerase [Dethiobacter alkaliphilus]|uniref:5-deoxy-glucuronate isomerase n=1 Tax=Dethiobacter alkaliphilus TaxID=427926 RepID=UPI002226EC3E|nr:5-deoxy-glucuronate isomerase [Dethiobacter alkaliphilus]MCW3489997.1 5-deoxy-glucuronate isomerase [Dethiobacter alkaliphilus]